MHGLFLECCLVIIFIYFCLGKKIFSKKNICGGTHTLMETEEHRSRKKTTLQRQTRERVRNERKRFYEEVIRPRLAEEARKRCTVIEEEEEEERKKKTKEESQHQ